MRELGTAVETRCLLNRDGDELVLKFFKLFHFKIRRFCIELAKISFVNKSEIGKRSLSKTSK